MSEHASRSRMNRGISLVQFLRLSALCDEVISYHPVTPRASHLSAVPALSKLTVEFPGNVLKPKTFLLNKALLLGLRPLFR